MGGWVVRKRPRGEGLGRRSRSRKLVTSVEEKEWKGNKWGDID